MHSMKVVAILLCICSELCHFRRCTASFLFGGGNLRLHSYGTPSPTQWGQIRFRQSLPLSRRSCRNAAILALKNETKDRPGSMHGSSFLKNYTDDVNKDKEWNIEALMCMMPDLVGIALACQLLGLQDAISDHNNRND